MTAAGLAIVRAHLERDEGLRVFPYHDTAGKITIGYGRNLSDDGISDAEATTMLETDLARAVAAVAHAFPWSASLTDARLGVLIELEFNVGLAGEETFRQMLAHLEAGEYPQAGQALLASAADHEEPARVGRWASALMVGVSA